MLLEDDGSGPGGDEGGSEGGEVGGAGWPSWTMKTF